MAWEPGGLWAAGAAHPVLLLQPSSLMTREGQGWGRGRLRLKCPTGGGLLVQDEDECGW